MLLLLVSGRCFLFWMLDGNWALDDELLNFVIAIAFYQADSVAEIYSTLGYLTAIISVIAMPIMPRAKYFQTLVLNVLGICIGSVSIFLPLDIGFRMLIVEGCSSLGYLVWRPGKIAYLCTWVKSDLQLFSSSVSRPIHKIPNLCLT